MSKKSLIQEHNPIIKECQKCHRQIGVREPFYQFSAHWKDPKASTTYTYTCENCAEPRSFAFKK